MTKQQLYTVVAANSGDVIDRGLTAAEAADIVLRHDSREYDIRPGELAGHLYEGKRRERFYHLWQRQQVANRGWLQTAIFVIAANRAAAEAAIFAEVIGKDWPGRETVYKDEDYAALEAQWAAEEEA